MEPKCPGAPMKKRTIVPRSQYYSKEELFERTKCKLDFTPVKLVSKDNETHHTSESDKKRVKK